jgi:hypothetical protein
MNPTQPYTPPPFQPGGPPQGPIPIQPGSSGSGGGDNQWMIFLAIGCASLCLFCLCAIGVGGVFYAANDSGSGGGLVDLGGGGGGDTVHITATVTSFIGSVPGVSTGTVCDLPITATTDPEGTQTCHVVMTCGGVSLYGDAASGYFPCQFSTSPPSVMGQDTDTTLGDQDGSFHIGTMGGYISLIDDPTGRNGMFELAATINTVE